ncbi:hypothetical protein WMW72_00955 [Paenibacillus filicis]|uniref:Alpha-tubulin suppressor n=1 Tax=Paenibacillus filicis TaxID=669464 RepID=A0ABU9DCA0_9BACL
MFLRSSSQQSRVGKWSRSLLLTGGLSLLLAAQSLAAPVTEKVAEKTAEITVSAFGASNIVHTSGGEVWYWGGLFDISDGKHTYRDNRPQIIKELKDTVSVQSSSVGPVVLKKDGTVWQWDIDIKRKSQDKPDGIMEFKAPKQIEGLSNIVKISISNGSAAIDKDGAVWVWHPDYYYTGPHKLTNITGAKDISMNGDAKLLILKEDGSVSEWNSYNNMQTNDNYTATPIKDLTGVVALSAGQGRNHLVIKKDGTVWGWGNNYGGSLGQPITTAAKELPTLIERPTLVKSLTDVSSITTSVGRTLVLKKDGSLWVMGYDVDEYNFPYTGNPELRRIEGLKKVTSIAMGHYHALAVTEDGKLWAWGGNKAGQLGDASFKSSKTPILIKSFK